MLRSLRSFRCATAPPVQPAATEPQMTTYPLAAGDPMTFKGILK